MKTTGSLQELFGGIDIYIFDQLLKGRFAPGMRVLDAGCGSGRNLVYFLRSGYEVFGVDESAPQIARVRQMAAELAPHLPAENFRIESVESMSWGAARGNDPRANASGAGLESDPPANAGGTDRTAESMSWGAARGNDPRANASGAGLESDPPANAGGTDRTAESMSWGAARGNDPPTNADGAGQSRADAAGFDVVLSSAVLHFARDEEQWQAMLNEMWRVLKPGGIFFARLASTIGIEGEVKLIEGRRYRLPDGSDRFLVDEAMLHRVTAELRGEFIEPIKTTVVENMRAMTTWVVRKS